jgi:hypothetical protein
VATTRGQRDWLENDRPQPLATVPSYLPVPLLVTAGSDNQEHADDGAVASLVYRLYHAAVINLTDQGYRAHPLAGSAKRAIVWSAGL